MQKYIHNSTLCFLNSEVDIAMATPKPKTDSRRLYQVWKGNNRFFCGGRLIFGPDMTSLLLSVLLIIGPSLTFCIQIIRKIAYRAIHNEEDIDDRSPILGFPVLIVTAIVTLLDLVFLFLTSSRDPGIIPRNTRQPDSDEFSVNTPSMEWLNGRTPHLRLPRAKDVVMNGITVKVKFCDTCLLYRPPRSSHCSVCNNCVHKFDHHCPWVDQCVGLRNYRCFFLFVSTSTFLCLLVFVASWLNVVEEKKLHGSLLRSMRGEAVSVVLIVYTFVAVWFVGGLSIFHLYLISKNQTTYENFRYRYEKKENPFDKGVLKNFMEVFFSRIPASMFNFRSWAVEETIESTYFSTGIAASPKKKIDVEMGSSTYMESMLQNLDYAAIECDNIEGKDRPGEEEKDEFARNEFVDYERDDVQVVDGIAEVGEDGTLGTAIVDDTNTQ